MTIIPILMYHSISREGTDRFRKFTLSPEMFTQHIEYIASQGYTPITVAEYGRLVSVPAPVSLPDKPIIITFDDGFADFYTAAFPTLERFRFPASLYIVTGCMEGTSKWLEPEGEQNRKMLSWSQLSEIQKAGIECGAHSVTHLHLDTAKPEIACQEIVHSKDELEQRLGVPVYSLAYPYGHYCGKVRQFVIEAGYTAACAVRNCMSHTGDDLFNLGRIIITRQTSVASLKNLLAGKNLPLAPRYEYPWVTGWRQVRRVQQLFSRVSQ